MKKLTDHLQTFALGLLAFAGIVIGIVDFFGYSFSWLKEVPTATLVLVGVIAINHTLDRLTIFKRLEERMHKLEEGRNTLVLSQESRKKMREAIDCYITLELLFQAPTKKKNVVFGDIVRGLLNEQFILLQSLSNGKINVPE